MIVGGHKGYDTVAHNKEALPGNPVCADYKERRFRVVKSQNVGIKSVAEYLVLMQVTSWTHSAMDR